MKKCEYCQSQDPCFDGLTNGCNLCRHPECKIQHSEQSVDELIEIWRCRIQAFDRKQGDLAMCEPELADIWRIGLVCLILWICSLLGDYLQ